MNEAPLDLSFLQATPVFSYQGQRITLVLVGTGGTGSYLARHIARLAWILKTQYNKTVTIAFIDPDVVEPANVLRQDFCEAELGLPKATVLALRYTAAFGIEIHPIVQRFHPDMIRQLRSYWNTLTLVIGAVDNAGARAAISETLKENLEQEVPRVWWLDCGNAREAGQVLIGSQNNLEDLADAFKVTGYCRKLPSPVMQHPELLNPLPEELDNHHLSCAQLTAANSQSLMVNQQVAAHAAVMLHEFLIAGRLRRFATYFDLPSGTASSKYITQEAVARVIGREVSFFSTAGQPVTSGRPQELVEDEEFFDENSEFDEEM